MSRNDARLEPLGGFEQRLLTALREVHAEQAAEVGQAAARRPARPAWRRRPLWLLAAGLAGAAVLAAMPVVMRPAKAEAIEVRVGPGGEFVMTAGDRRIETRAELEAALRELGLRYRIEELPSGPGMVGRVVDIHGRSLGELRGQLGGVWYLDPRSMKGPITISIGRDPHPGEFIPFPESAMARGEPLAGVDCRPDWPLSTRAFERLAAARGYRLLWVRWDTGYSTWSDGGRIRVEPSSATRPDGKVLDADIVGRDTLLVHFFEPSQKDTPPGFLVHGGHGGPCRAKGSSASP